MSLICKVKEQAGVHSQINTTSSSSK